MAGQATLSSLQNRQKQASERKDKSLGKLRSRQSDYFQKVMDKMEQSFVDEDER